MRGSIYYYYLSGGEAPSGLGIYLNIGGAVKQVSGVYALIGGAVKQLTPYALVGSEVKAI